MKRINVIWTDESLLDLEAIYDFISLKSSKSAEKIIRAILSRSRQLETQPYSGSYQDKVPGIEKEYRYLVEKHYKIIYRVEDAVYVVAVIDTRQNPAR